MSEFPDELGWIEFPGSERAAWATSSSPSAGSGAPAPDGAGGAVPGRAFKRGLVFTRGRRERARREATAEWRRQRMAAIRERSLKSGVITVGSGFGGTGKTDVAVTLAAIYAAARPADRVIFADTNDAMPHGYSRLGGAPVEEMPRHRRPLSMRGFHHACLEGGIRVYADLRDAVAWLQGVAVIRGDTADECAGADFGEQEYLTVLEFLQRMSNIVINDGGTGLFTRLQAGTLLHADKYVFVTEASELGFWSIGQVFSRYRNYEGEKERPLTEQEMKHLSRLIDEATVVVDKFAESDPEQVRWLAQIRESLEGTRVSVAATPWDQSLANRVPLDLGAVAGSTLDAKLAMAEVVLHGADRAYRRRQGLPDEETENCGDGQQDPAESPRWLSEPPADGLDSADPEPDTPAVRIIAVPPAADSLAAGPVTAASATDTPDPEPGAPDVRIMIPAQRAADSPAAGPVTAAGAPDVWPDTPNVRIIHARTESDSRDTEPTILDPFRSVRYLGLVSSGCPGGSGSSEGCSSAWFPVARPWSQLMVFKSVRGSRPASAATCLVGTREWVAKQDHPAPRPLQLVDLAVMTLFPSGFAGPRLLGGGFVGGGAKTLAGNDRSGAARALSRDAALQRVRGDGVRRSLVAPLRVAVGVIHHDQQEGECEDRDDHDGDNVACGSCHVGTPFETTVSVSCGTG